MQVRQDLIQQEELSDLMKEEKLGRKRRSFPWSFPQ